MKKNICKAVVFILVFAVSLCLVCSSLNFKYQDSVFKVKMFYEQEDNTVDVLVLGSSHIYQGINTAVLWREYGIAAYNLCGAAQPIWNTYYYLEEALKTQTPKAILLDVYTLHYTNDYSDTSFAIKNTYGLKWSDTKKAAIQASFDEEKSGKQYYFPILQYHSRYSDLDKTDFYPYLANKEMYENHKGFYCYFNTTPVEEPELESVVYKNNLTAKNNEYYRKILNLAAEKNIPVIVTALPFDAEPYHQAFFNTAKEIAAECGCEFYNFLSDYKDALGIDYSEDFADSQHLNYKGNTKLTRFFGEILKEKYNIPDRRSDAKYSSWEADARVYYNQLENHLVSENDELNDYSSALTNSRYKIIVTESLGGSDEISRVIKILVSSFFEAAGIGEEEYTKGGMWIIEGGKPTYYNNCRYPDFGKSVTLGSFHDAYVDVREMKIGNKTVDTYSISYDKENKTTVPVGINILIYDEFTDSVIDAAGFDFSSGEVTHKQ